MRLSSYFDSDECHPLCKKKKNCFRVAYSNIQSSNAKFSELGAFVDLLKTEHVQLSGICPQESCICKNDDSSPIQLDGYNSTTQANTSRERRIHYIRRLTIKCYMPTRELYM